MAAFRSGTPQSESDLSTHAPTNRTREQCIAAFGKKEHCKHQSFAVKTLVLAMVELCPAERQTAEPLRGDGQRSL